MANRPHWYTDDENHPTRNRRRTMRRRRCPSCQGRGTVLGGQAYTTGGETIRCPQCQGERQILENVVTPQNPPIVRQGTRANEVATHVNNVNVTDNPRTQTKSIAHAKKKGTNYARLALLLVVFGAMAFGLWFLLFPENALQILQALSEPKVIILK